MIYIKIIDPVSATYGVDDPIYAVSQLAQTAMRSEIGKIVLDKTFEEREELIIKLFSDKHYVPMKEKELAILLRVEPEDREELSNVLNSLLHKRKIQVNKRGKYSLYDGRSKENRHP